MRVVIVGLLGIVALVVLVTRAFVAEPAGQDQPAASPSPNATASFVEAASIRIETPATSGDQGVRVPVNVRIDPNAGLDEDMPLQVLASITVDAQPFAGAQVSVPTAETVAVATDPRGAFRLPLRNLGRWDELTSAAGADFVLAFDPSAGAINVTLEIATGDDTPRLVSATTSRAFDVEPVGESLLTRIERDYRAGVITADEAARHSMLSAIDPDYRAERYADLYDDDIPEDPQALGLFAVSLLPEVSAATRAELEGYLDGTRHPGAEAGSEAAAGMPVATTVGFQPAADSDCDGPIDALLCSTPVERGDPATGGLPIDLLVLYVVGDGEGHVEDRDDDDNGRPDQIDALIASYVEAWRFFRDGLGMRAVDHRVTIVLDDVNRASSVGDGDSGVITMPPDATPYLVRHELFHQVQYEYFLPTEGGLRYDHCLWLMEATAEWASAEAEQRLGPHGDAPGAGAYAASLDDALGEPHRSIDHVDLGYGSFPFFEYLEQAHGGNGVVENVLRGTGEGFFGRRPTRVIADQVPSWTDAIVEYRQWSYLLTRDERHDVGFAAPDSDHNTVSDIDQYWRPVLQGDPRTAGRTQWVARPARAQSLDRSSTPMFAVAGSTGIHPGGAVYVEVDVPRGTRHADIDIETGGEEIRTVAMPTARYPRLCQPPTSVHIRPPGSAADTTLHRTCERLVLLLVNAAQPAVGLGAEDVRWTIFVDATRPEPATRPAAPATEPTPAGNAAWDILRHHVAYGDTVELAMDLAAPVDPASWPDRAIVQWRLEVRREDEIGYANVLVWPSGVVEVHSDRGHVSCSSVNPGTEHAFDGTSHRVTLPPDCLQMDGLSGPPTELRVAAIAGILDRFVDSAPNGHTMDGPVTSFDGPVPQGQRATFEDDDTS
jgi:hypothetical protein